MGYALRHPLRIGMLLNLGASTKTAAQALAEQMVGLLGDLARIDQSSET